MAEAKKIAIIYGEYKTGIQKKAIDRLTEIIVDYTAEYPVCFASDGFCDGEGFRCIYIGTAKNNPFIKSVGTEHPTNPESYRILVKDGTVYIEGADDAGVLYGCSDFYDRYLLPIEYPHNGWKYVFNPFDKPLPDAEISSAPAIKNRGIWTWGHVIYDWRGFIDNMVKLKMNVITVWNDFPPLNAKDMVAYAHDCGIKVIWGYPWLWDTDCLKADISDLGKAAKAAFDRYERDYASVGGDGIYFQSFTETKSETIGGRLIADAVTELVNRGAAMFFEKYPGIELQFGLHAESVKERLSYIKNIDPRIRIVWENCGAFPFSYIPNDVADFGKTADFVRTLTHLRENERFGAVTKGLVKLDWNAFEHPRGPMAFGATSEKFKENRIVRKHKFWKYIQAYWLTNAPKAGEMMRLMAKETDGDTYVTALIEDGMFEREIMYPAAVSAEFMWDGESDFTDIMNRTALRSYVTFA